MNALAPVRRLFDWKIRGVRWIEIIGAVAVAVMILSVYVAKTAAARENARIGEIEREGEIGNGGIEGNRQGRAIAHLAHDDTVRPQPHRRFQETAHVHRVRRMQDDVI